jgi:hypothetical protein
MRQRLLLGYQLLTGLSDGSTGLLLLFAPALTLHLMGLRVAIDALPFLSYIGAFVLSVGIACLYGASLVGHRDGAAKLEVVWLLTAITRGLVAVFVLTQVLAGRLEAGWMTVALSDGGLALLQAFGLARGWLSDVRG